MDKKPRTPEEILEFRKRWFRLTGIIAVTLWLLWFVFAVMLAFFTADEPIARFGQVGDAFGSLNAIFGGAGFLGLLYTIYRQHLDTLEGEQRRRDDKKEEEAARAEAERLRREDKDREDAMRREENSRHYEDLLTQERIAIQQQRSANIHVFTTLITIRDADLQRLNERIRLTEKFAHYMERGVFQMLVTTARGAEGISLKDALNATNFWKPHHETIVALFGWACLNRPAKEFLDEWEANRGNISQLKRRADDLFAELNDCKERLENASGLPLGIMDIGEESEGSSEFEGGESSGMDYESESSDADGHYR